MKRRWIGVAVGAAAAGVLTGRRIARRARAPEPGGDRNPWHSLTVNRTPEELGHRPAPLGDLGIPVNIRVRPAPGGRGTELAVQLLEPEPTGVALVVAKMRNNDPVRKVRRALREARQLAEVGEILLPDTPPTTRRTLTGAPLAYAVRHGREEGRL
jgi:hypothetical protein